MDENLTGLLERALEQAKALELKLESAREAAREVIRLSRAMDMTLNYEASKALHKLERALL